MAQASKQNETSVVALVRSAAENASQIGDVIRKESQDID